VLAELDDFNGAALAIRKAIELRPRPDDDPHLEGYVRLWSGDANGALAAFETVLKANEALVDADSLDLLVRAWLYLGRGRAAQLLHRDEDARVSYEGALRSFELAGFGSTARTKRGVYRAHAQLAILLARDPDPTRRGSSREHAEQAARWYARAGASDDLRGTLGLATGSP
jgi:tetratricopeptide (TPR) repeat protein